MYSKQKKSNRKYDSSKELLQGAGLRPTQQRLALANWLFKGCPKHVTAEQVHAAARKMRAPVSLATVYNTLNHLIEAGLLRQVAIGGQVYFDTNAGGHHHLFDEKSGRLSDIPATSLRIAGLPRLPHGKALSRVDVVVRVR